MSADLVFYSHWIQRSKCNGLFLCHFISYKKCIIIMQVHEQYHRNTVTVYQLNLEIVKSTKYQVNVEQLLLSSSDRQALLSSSL